MGKAFKKNRNLENRRGDRIKLRLILGRQVVKLQLKWYGHAFRMGNERKVKQALELKVDGKRGRGRPRLTWEEGIKRIGNQRNKTLREG
jgi:hypothetical protein